MPIRSSYYTGYEDLDARLRDLYQQQTVIEKDLGKIPLTQETIERFRNVIAQQDRLLAIGRMRDRNKNRQ